MALPWNAVSVRVVRARIGWRERLKAVGTEGMEREVGAQGICPVGGHQAAGQASTWGASETTVSGQCGASSSHWTPPFLPSVGS